MVESVKTVNVLMCEAFSGAQFNFCFISTFFLNHITKLYPYYASFTTF